MSPILPTYLQSPPSFQVRTSTSVMPQPLTKLFWTVQNPISVSCLGVRSRAPCLEILPRLHVAPWYIPRPPSHDMHGSPNIDLKLKRHAEVIRKERLMIPRCSMPMQNSMQVAGTIQSRAKHSPRLHTSGCYLPLMTMSTQHYSVPCWQSQVSQMTGWSTLCISCQESTSVRPFNLAVLVHLRRRQLRLYHFITEKLIPSPEY